MAIFRVEKNRNYTVMSNHHLKNKNLTLKSKGLLSLILSLPEEWNYTTRGLASICKEGVDCIGVALRELESEGYLTRKKLRNEQGKIMDTEYTIYESPQKLTVSAQEEQTETSHEPHTAFPDTEKPDTENPYTVKPDTENPPQLITNRSKEKEKNIDSLTIHQSICVPYPNDSKPTDEKEIDSIDEMERYRRLIMENIEYETLCLNYNFEQLDEIVDVMLDCIYGKRSTIRVGGAVFPIAVVKSRLLKLGQFHIEYVCDCINRNTTKIGNIRAYLLAALYNAPTTIDHYYTTLVNHDQSNGFGKGG